MYELEDTVVYGHLKKKMTRLTSLLALVAVLLAVASNGASYSGSGPHIADVNILLPPKMTHPVEYRLQGSDGCFKWSWDHHDILSVLPEYNLSSHCSTSARLQSISPYTGRKETAVYATDVNTGMIIRCKVYIDNFSRIQIFHSSIKLDLDGLATLRVRAFDSEENVFSSLVGLQFMWQLMPETDGLPHHLVHVPLKLSPLSDCGGLCGDLDVQIRLEDSGVFSDLYVVKGTEIGHELVSVHLLEPQYDHMADKIVLTVAEAMSLDPPSPVYVLIGAVVQYILKVVRENIPQEVTLPSPYHRWSVLNSSVSQVDKMMGKAYAMRLGVTTLTVEDTRVMGHIQMSSLHVVLPDTLALYILPLSLSGNLLEGVSPNPSVLRWYVVSGRQYIIETKVFSQGPGAQEIYITENDDVKLHDDHSEYWNMFPVSDSIAFKHEWWNSRILKATSFGLGKLTATLRYSTGHYETKEVLKVVQEVMVCDQVKFSMDGRSASESILLPWAPAVYQEMELKATGGCAIASSDYKWFSSDMAIVSLSAYGIVQSKKPGKAIVKVVSIFDPFNYDEVVVEVSIPSSMAMQQNHPVETVVGSSLPAFVTLKTSTGAYYDRCDAFSSSIRWKTGSELFTIVNTERESFVLDEQEVPELYISLNGPSCAWTHAYASGTGRTILHASLTKEHQSIDHSVSGPIDLKASSVISAYLPLIVHQVGDGNQYGGYWFNLSHAEAHNQLENLNILNLVPGTHMDVRLYGGPERWNQGVEFIETVETLPEEHANPKGVLVNDVTSSYGTYRILCRRWGTFKLLFKRGNLVGDGHLLPAVAEVELLLTCSLPSSVSLIVDEAFNSPDVIQTATHADRDSRQIRVVPITVANGRTIRVSAVGISDSGKAFGNSSSLGLRWEMRNCDGLALWDDVDDLATAKSSWERFLVLLNSSALCIVHATVVGFIDTSSGHHSTKPFDSSESVLTDAVRLQLVSTLRISPEFSLLFFSPVAKLNLSISGGSCSLDAVVNDTLIVEVIESPPDLQCLQLLLAPKRLGTALVTIFDTGLAPPIAASSVVQVADLEWLKITSGEQISLMEGSSQFIDFLAGVNDGHTFNSSQYSYMNIRVHIEDHIVDVIESFDIASAIDGYVKAPNFIIQARHLGVTTLYLSARQQSGLEILSQPIKIEVYAPPSIHPSDIFLVPGASYVLSVKGGPTVGSYVEFASMDDETAIIHKSLGRLNAIAPGNTTLVATVHGNGDKVICQAYGRVIVGVPSSVMLNVQSEQLAIGHDMPIYPSLSKGNLFSFYELCKNYEWTVEDEKVLSFKAAEPLHEVKHGVPFALLGNIRSTDEHDFEFVQVLYGRSSGRTGVTVSFSCDFISGSFSQSRFYNASLSLYVVPDLPLALGIPVTWVLPSHYTTTNLLPSSSDSYSQGDGPSRKGTITYSLLTEFGGKSNVELQKSVITTDGFRIKTTESNNLGCIQARDRLTGRTEIASCVRVAEVAQIRISTKSFPFRTINVAVGTELYVPITYYDTLGYPFLEAYNVILFEAETNNRDVVFISNTRDSKGNIYLKALHHGKALVQISFSSNPRKSDYLLISVGARLYPQNPVLKLGNRLNFSIEGLTDHVSGCWLSDNASVISIDQLSGKAEAIGVGSTKVTFEGSSLELQTVVTVSKGAIVSVAGPKEMLTNAPFPAKGYDFYVKFSDAFNHNHEAAGNANGILYDCRVDPPFVGFAKPWRDIDTGNSYCLFFPYSPEHLVRSIGKSKERSQDISVSINASLRGANHVSASASALFIGGFSILEMDQNSLHLNLTPESDNSVITIVGNTDVEIHWQDRDQLLITPIHIEDHRIAGRAQYEVRVLRAERFKDKVIITLAANGQRVEIDVNYEPGKRTELAVDTDVNWAIIFWFLVFLFFTVCLFVWHLDRPGRSQPTVAPATPIAAAQSAPVTPQRRSPAVVNDQSLQKHLSLS